jgi:glycosyltransferase involved in cell wall biosynthesis
MNKDRPETNTFHVVYILTQLELGGAQKVCLELFNHFAPNSYLISSQTGILLEQVKNDPHFFGLAALQREVSLKTAWKELIAFLNIYLHLIRLKQKHAFIIVHTHSSKAGILGRLAAYLAGIKNVVHTVHGFGITTAQAKTTFFLFALLEQLATFLTNVIICVSKCDQEAGSRLFYGFAKKAIIIRAAVNEGPFLIMKKQATCAKKRNASENKIILGSISCFKPQKNLLDLIKAFYLTEKLCPVKTKVLMLEIIGDGAMRSEIEERITRYGLGDKIKLLGWQEDVLPKMLNWDCFVLTSLWEGLPCSLIQALLLDQAAICYDTGGISEVIKDGENGFLVKQRDLFTFAEKLTFLKNIPKSEFTKKTMPEKTANFFIATMLSRHRDVYTNFFI